MHNTHQHLDEQLFCETMILHYREMYRRRMRGWHFKSAAFAWKRWKYYSRMLDECNRQLQSVLNEINIHHATPVITTAG